MLNYTHFTHLFSNWSWNICAMVNWTTVIKYIVCFFTSDSVWTILPTRIRKIHQVVLGLNIGSELLFLRLACTLSPLLHKCSVLALKAYHNIFHSWCQVRFTYIIGTNVCQLQTSFTSIYFVHLTLFSIPYKMHSSCNVSGMFGILTILNHAHSRFSIQYNQSSFLWNHVWIFI